MAAAVGNSNRVVGWASLAVGAGTGLILGLWSFDGPFAVPAWLGAYGDVSRRLARLGHIAFFGLGILNLLLARELPALAEGEKCVRCYRILPEVGTVSGHDELCGRCADAVDNFQVAAE